jgi:hypothetical protein
LPQPSQGRPHTGVKITFADLLAHASDLSPFPLCSEIESGLEYWNVSALFLPWAVTAPRTAENVWHGIPSQWAQAAYSRVSSNNVSPTSKTTDLIIARFFHVTGRR